MQAEGEVCWVANGVVINEAHTSDQLVDNDTKEEVEGEETGVVLFHFSVSAEEDEAEYGSDHGPDEGGDEEPVSGTVIFQPLDVTVRLACVVPTHRQIQGESVLEEGWGS